ncbi:MAG: dTDP-4-dehydrorhamnose reductase [Gammaproteobacteria bacterium]|nr:dTDP-4-dehydrorhamnose reductase [Gammaproteobacteria bacterium]
MNRILVTGIDGQVGWELCRSLAGLGQVIGLNHAKLDLSNPDSIRNTVRELQPNLIVNAAAYTAVDRAESEPEIAMQVNGIAPGVLAEEIHRLGGVLIHYSTDYVFDGSKEIGYTENDAPAPLNVYGKTKLAGERAIKAVDVPHLIFRTSWVYGNRGKNFLLTMLRLAREKKELHIVNNQYGAPTWCRGIAEITAHIITALLQHNPHRYSVPTEYSGVYHLTATGKTSWHEFAMTIFKFLNHPQPVIRPISSSHYPQAVRRPANSILSNKKLYERFNVILPAWDDSLKLCLDERVVV